MAKLIWDDVGDKVYEAGVSNGVFYDKTGAGVPWNGLISIDEEPDVSAEPVYFDGTKISDVITVGDYVATMTAFTYPDELLPYQGIVEHDDGYFVPDQPFDRFGLSYQTKIGDDVSGLTVHYKIHILYNVAAIPTQRSYQTLALETEASNFEWAISTLPEEVANHRATGHLIFDSRKIDPVILSQLEDLIYGNSTNDAQLPSMKRLLETIRTWVAAL